MVYNLTDLDSQDQYAHSDLIFSRDMTSYDKIDDIDYDIIDYNDDILVRHNNNRQLIISKGERKLSNDKYGLLKPCFLFKPKEIIERTLEATTQYGGSTLSGPIIWNRFQSPFPANNVL